LDKDTSMADIGIGIVGTGYMGKLHSVAMHSVATVFDTPLRPVCEMICATTEAGAAAKAKSFGFNRSTHDWRVLVNDDKVEAVVIASPQKTHLEIAKACLALGKPVLCEKPLGESLSQSREMVDAAAQSKVTNMVGFNYMIFSPIHKHLPRGVARVGPTALWVICHRI